MPGRVEKHLHLLGVLWFAVSALTTIGGLVLLVLGTTLFPHMRELTQVPPNVPLGFLCALLNTLGILVLAKAAAGFFAGWGLLRREPWARTLSLVLAFIALFNVPFGTAIGVYTLWVMLPGHSGQEYKAMVDAQAA